MKVDQNASPQHSVAKKYTPKDAIAKEIAIIKQFGIFPIYNQSIPGNRFIFLLKCLSNIVITILFLGSIWMNIIVNFDDSAEVIETLYFGLTETTFVSKLINLHFRHQTFQRLEEYLSTPEFSDYADDDEIFIKKGVRIVEIFSQIFRGAVTATILFFIVFPFLDSSEGILILPSWFPPEVEKYEFLCYFFQLWGIIINGYVHSSHDNIAAGLIMIGSAQFEILKNNLNNLGNGLKVSESERERVMQEEYVLTKLSKCVKHHVITIKYAYEIENMFSPVQFVQFLASSIIICVTGFQIIVTPITDLKFITLLLYFSCNLIQCVMCCWFGHDIKDKSDGIAEACYMSEWYECGIRVGRTISIIMERAKRPVTLTAGKFFDLTLQTLMQILKTSYSYLALLRRMNEIERL